MNLSRAPGEHATRHVAMAAEADLLSVLKSVMKKLQQDEGIAVAWHAELDGQQWIKSPTAAMTLLRGLRAETNNKTDGPGGDGWRNLVAALGQAGVPEAAFKMCEALLIEELDAIFTPGSTPCGLSTPVQQKQKACTPLTGSRPTRARASTSRRSSLHSRITSSQRRMTRGCRPTPSATCSASFATKG